MWKPFEFKQPTPPLWSGGYKREGSVVSVRFTPIDPAPPPLIGYPIAIRYQLGEVH